jgi:hypothetical protein
MSNVFAKAFKLIVGESATDVALRMPKGRPLKKLTERELIQLESEIGSKLFGVVPRGHRREFFCLDAKTWIWHEANKDPKTGKALEQTIRYEVHDNGILKVQEGPRYSFIDGEELNNFITAITMYHEQVARNVYGRDPQTGQKIA